MYWVKRPDSEISIHALREEGDTKSWQEAAAATEFLSTPSARRATLFVVDVIVGSVFLSTPSARRATHERQYNSDNKRFLSTPSARRATIVDNHNMCVCEDFYPRPPRGGRRCCRRHRTGRRCISIHALREEGDADYQQVIDQMVISIHALREEGDPPLPLRCRIWKNFYPRPP